MTKNYYQILGVSELCTNQELKSAYRKLARQWHPDIAGNTEDVVSKFKEITEAYEVLSDNVKRAEYDTLNRLYNYSSTKKEEKNTVNNSNTTQPNFKDLKQEDSNNSGKKGFSFNWDEFVSKYKEYSAKFDYSTNKKTEKKQSAPEKGKDISTDVEITIVEAINGTTKIINMLHTQVCQKCGGRKFINGCICTHCKGKGSVSEHKRFSVKIPAGVKDNSKIRLAGEGEKGINGGVNGDLYITVHIKAPLDYKTEGNNIIKTVQLAPYEAVLGGNIKVKTQDGDITVKISPNTQNGQKIRLCGCGINVNGRVGDMILIIEIQIPKNLSNLEVELYRKLQELSSQSVK